MLTTQQNISGYERGRLSPTVDTLYMMAQVLHVSVEALLFGDARTRNLAGDIDWPAGEENVT